MKTNSTETANDSTTIAASSSASATGMQPPLANETVLLTPEQLARVFSISRRTLSNWTAQKIIPMTKIGRTCRFDLQKVRAALAKYEQGTAA
ncbi:helix-turn-helix domain-containing protein [Prosthecobacter sp.]|uniref:helix-turn-helix domain-containing protein n=1 Tax=Prosthecobacter sp. TaxID=1965333 RepID=UPI003784BFFC